MDTKLSRPRATAVFEGGEGLKSMHCGAMSAQRGYLFPIHTGGSWGGAGDGILVDVAP